MEDLDLESFGILFLVLLVPAIVIFIVVTVVRVRRGRFHRQRITKRSSRDS